MSLPKAACSAAVRSSALQVGAAKAQLQSPPVATILKKMPGTSDPAFWSNPRVESAEYAVRGKIVQRSEEIKKQLESGKHNFNFDETIPCNIGNPQAMLQKPIEYYRQVAALINCPWMLESGKLDAEVVPADVIARAKEMLAGIGHMHKTGAYTESAGYAWVRKNLAAALERRDGVPANPDDLFLTDGASPGIRLLMQLLLNGEGEGVMIPIPQYPLYTATIALLGGTKVPYYLSEEGAWQLDTEDLIRSYDKAIADGINVKVIVVINPGNPTGHVLTEDQVRLLCQFANDRGLVLMADEVYQENIYLETDKFVSFKSVAAREFPQLPVASFHSVSKGFIGECGKRGGYFELLNFPEVARKEVMKLSSIGLCPNVNGQILVDLMMNPPVKGDPSYETWAEEYFGLRESLMERAKLLEAGLNAIPGIKTNPITGAMYAFPSLTLPPKFIAEAEAEGVPADELWCSKLLEFSGVILVPGSGFGQRPGTYHFRITILPPKEKLEKVVKYVSEFMAKISKEYA